ncbi:MAG: rhodanese-like domain-containing protein [Bacteroidota bacterium]|nr:rhodanese-like domain-containing protein [Bacteroidota bacterium]
MPSFSQLNVEDFYIRLNTETNKLILDVRPYRAFKKEHIPGSISVNDRKTLFTLTDTLDLEIYLFVYCDDYSRSLEVCQILQEQSFQNIYMLNGGFIEWKKRKFEVYQKKSWLKKRNL